jgi:hypothetical protein
VAGQEADQLRLLFLVTDVLMGSFRPQLLVLDDSAEALRTSPRWRTGCLAYAQVRNSISTVTGGA